MSVQEFIRVSAGNGVQYLGTTAAAESLAGGMLALIPPLSGMSFSVLAMRLVAMVMNPRERGEDVANVCLSLNITRGGFSRLITIQR